MSVCACIKITMARCGQNADDSAVSAISTGVWVGSAAVAVSEGPRHGCALGKPSLPCVKQDKNESSTSGWPGLLASQCLPVVPLLCFWCCRAPTRAKHPLPTSLAFLADHSQQP